MTLIARRSAPTRICYVPLKIGAISKMGRAILKAGWMLSDPFAGVLRECPRGLKIVARDAVGPNTPSFLKILHEKSTV